MKNVQDESQKDRLHSVLDAKKLEDIRIRSCFVTNLDRGKLINDNQLDKLRPALSPFVYELDEDHCFTFNGVVREAAAELWFCTDDLDGISIPQMIVDVIAKCPIDCRKTLAESIVLTGGTSMIPGLKSRLIRELKLLSNSVLKGQANSFRLYKCPVKPSCINWVGGAIYGASEAINFRSIPKEHFLKTGTVPDWCDQSVGNVFGNVVSSNYIITSSPFNIGKGL